MTVKIHFPGGVWIEADSLPEAVAIAKTFAPNIMDEVPTPAPPKRTRVMVTNRDLSILDSWGLRDEGIYESMNHVDWKRLAEEVGRTVPSTQSMTRRYIWGVYESTGSDPAALVKLHADKDRSRPRPPAVP